MSSPKSASTVYVSREKASAKVVEKIGAERLILLSCVAADLHLAAGTRDGVGLVVEAHNLLHRLAFRSTIKHLRKIGLALNQSAKAHSALPPSSVGGLADGLTTLVEQVDVATQAAKNLVQDTKALKLPPGAGPGLHPHGAKKVRLVTRSTFLQRCVKADEALPQSAALFAYLAIAIGVDPPALTGEAFDSARRDWKKLLSKK
jgi:hypothetical protein